MTDITVPFNRPYITGRELDCIAQAQRIGHLSGDGPFTDRCHQWIEDRTGSRRALLTHSCTAALELAALLFDVGVGDEVIMPSYTFVSTANAFVLRGATPVFVDVRPDTLNLDERLVEAAITPRTRVVAVVHYAGVACEMDSISAIARRHGLRVVEDAAHGMTATYRGRPLGAIGDLGAYSFHETKNIIAGEGGCLLVNVPELIERAEILREKGTDRGRFNRGEVDKYTWQDIGSSFLPGELAAAFLWAQLGEANGITERRLAIWRRYHNMLEPLEQRGRLARPVIPPGAGHNGHLYYVLLDTQIDRRRIIGGLLESGITALFHYVPLHSSPAGKRFGRWHGDLAVTDSVASRVLRLPLWVGLADEQQDHVVATLTRLLG